MENEYTNGESIEEKRKLIFDYLKIDNRSDGKNSKNSNAMFIPLHMIGKKNRRAFLNL